MCCFSSEEVAISTPASKNGKPASSHIPLSASSLALSIRTMVTFSSFFAHDIRYSDGQLKRKLTNFRGMKIYFHRAVGAMSRFLYSLSTIFFALLLNRFPTGLIGIMMLTVSYLDIFPIASMMLFNGSSGCILNVLML